MAAIARMTFEHTHDCAHRGAALELSAPTDADGHCFVAPKVICAAYDHDDGWRELEMTHVKIREI